MAEQMSLFDTLMTETAEEELACLRSGSGMPQACTYCQYFEVLGGNDPDYGQCRSIDFEHGDEYYEGHTRGQDCDHFYDAELAINLELLDKAIHKD